jgi:hypothetical protein
LTPVAYGCEIEEIKIPIEAVNTHREKPLVRLHHKNCKKFGLNNRFVFTTNSGFCVF